MLPPDAGAGDDGVALVPEAVQALVVDEAPLPALKNTKR